VSDLPMTSESLSNGLQGIEDTDFIRPEMVRALSAIGFEDLRRLLMSNRQVRHHHCEL